MRTEHHNKYVTAATQLVDRLLMDHPEWKSNMLPVEALNAIEIDTVLLSVSPPTNPAHRLEVEFRGDTFEVSYGCGVSIGRAEAQFIFRDDNLAEAIDGVQEFLRHLCEGDIVVVVESLGRLTRALRGDGPQHLARFRRTSDVDASKRRYARVFKWSERTSDGE
jgi:hypothetical protein